jgi:hypothetical protein
MVKKGDSMTTIVTPSDYSNITKVFTTEEIKEKYGKLIVMSNEEYFKYTHPIRERKVKKMR